MNFGLVVINVKKLQPVKCIFQINICFISHMSCEHSQYMQNNTICYYNEKKFNVPFDLIFIYILWKPLHCGQSVCHIWSF